MGAQRAARHVPAYARALMEPYTEEMDALRDSAASSAAAPTAAGRVDDGLGGEAAAWLRVVREALLLL